MDGSVDAGKVEDELIVIVILYCMKDNLSEEIRSCTRFFSVQAPSRADAAGLIECIGGALKKLGIDNLLDQAKVLGVEGKPVLVGGGTDGASVNISEQNGMRGTMQRALLGYFGDGAMLIAWSLLIKIPCQVSCSKISRRCY